LLTEGNKYRIAWADPNTLILTVSVPPNSHIIKASARCWCNMFRNDNSWTYIPEYKPIPISFSRYSLSVCVHFEVSSWSNRTLTIDGSAEPAAYPNMSQFVKCHDSVDTYNLASGPLKRTA
jgi:hypothetical protein